jgi:hypothetical protein
MSLPGLSSWIPGFRFGRIEVASTSASSSIARLALGVALDVGLVLDRLVLALVWPSTSASSSIALCLPLGVALDVGLVSIALCLRWVWPTSA